MIKTIFSSHLLAYATMLLLAMVVVLSTTPYGAALSSDSLSYLLTAKNIVSGLGVTTPSYDIGADDPVPLTMWPPLYPLLLAVLFQLSDGDFSGVVNLAPLINGLLLSLTLILIYKFTVELLGAHRLVGWGLVLVYLFSPPNILIGMYLWSENVFIPLVFAAYFLVVVFLVSEEEMTSWARLALSAILLGLATYTRYVGVFYFLALCLTILLLSIKPIWERLLYVLIVSAIYLVFTAPLFLRNYFVSAHISGADRGSPQTRVFDDIERLLGFLREDLFWMPTPMSVFIGLVIMVSIASFIKKDNRSACSMTDLRIFAVTVLWVAIYILGWLAARSSQSIDLDSRMLGVISILMVLLPFVAYRLYPVSLGRWAFGVSVYVWMLFQIYHGMETITEIRDSWRVQRIPGQIGLLHYNSVTTPQLDVFRFIKDTNNPASADLIITDYPKLNIVAYFMSGSRVVRLPPPLAVIDKIGELRSRYRIIFIITTPSHWEAIQRYFSNLDLELLYRLDFSPPWYVAQISNVKP